MESSKKAYLIGEYDWTGKNPQADSLESFFGIIEDRQNAAKPVVAGDLFWSLFMHDLPNHETYVQHNDSFTMHYGDPANTPLENTQIGLTVNHFYRMAGRTSVGGCSK